MKSSYSFYPILLVIISGLSWHNSAHAVNPKFGLNSLRGNYGFVANGFMNDGSTYVPLVRTGIVKFSGDGKCTVTGQTKIGIAAATVDTPTDCTYTVDNNGNVELSSTSNLPLTYFTIVDHGKELLYIRTNPPNLVASGVAKKQ